MERNEPWSFIHDFSNLWVPFIGSSGPNEGEGLGKRVVHATDYRLKSALLC
jgi:hypothetical protein